MKLPSLTPFVTAGAIALGITTFSQSSQGQNAAARGFFCDTSSGVPVTIYQNTQGTQEPWIRWVSNAFGSSGYDPQTRCQEVSGRLETYRRNKQLKYITVGMSGGPIFNGNGLLIGINGRVKNRDPDFGVYAFEDGSEPSPAMLQQMVNSSWGIPISTYLQFVSFRSSLREFDARGINKYLVTRLEPGNADLEAPPLRYVVAL